VTDDDVRALVSESDFAVGTIRRLEKKREAIKAALERLAELAGDQASPELRRAVAHVRGEGAPSSC
jgi:hypothetical protein